MNEPRLPYENSGNESGKKVALGCGFGCLGAAIICLLIGFFVVRGLQSKAEALAGMASSEPMAFDYPRVQANEAEAVVSRFDNFRQAIANAKPAEPLVLTEDDLNILISQHPSFEPLAGKTAVKIVDNQIEARVSLKPEELPFTIPFISKAFAGKYINGTGKVDFSIQNEEARMYIVDFQLSGLPIPEEFKEQFKQENLMDKLLEDEEVKSVLDRIETLKIENNTLRIVPEATPE
ncbi:MAG: hypothetical protein P1U89_19445 [Verrucomicrobiales bacterium]|nr:hypothetical protein [Verrucomicrobiales bacterium]